MIGGEKERIPASSRSFEGVALQWWNHRVVVKLSILSMERLINRGHLLPPGGSTSI